jgi:energy-coupling factor transporter ATP-binding protein EcfA2
MRLGEIMVAQQIFTVENLQAALSYQRQEGGRIGDVIVKLGLATEQQVAEIIANTPASPHGLGEAGIAPSQLLNLIVKFMHLGGCETAPDLAAATKLPRPVIDELIREAVNRKLIQSMGNRPGTLVPVIRYALSDEGRIAAASALAQTQYLGPAPVPLAAYQVQVRRQSIKSGFLKAEALRAGFAGLELSEMYIRKLLPAINAGRTVLLYGPPGNGKTTVTARIAALLQKVIFVPYAVEIGGQIMKVFDPGIHQPVDVSYPPGSHSYEGLQIEAFDDRWVACRRPYVTVAGELTMDMLDLQYNAEARYYDAPAHVKALNGIFVIDDFGRQRASPTELLNRWISPMENQVDYMKLHTGQVFTMPFDQLLIFSTNLQPQDLMDPAFLRRIPYKIHIAPPEEPEYRKIFDTTAKAYGLTMPDDVFAFIVAALKQGKFGLAGFQPRFICDQVAEYCRSFGIEPVMTKPLAAEALTNLYVQIGQHVNAAA